MKKYATMLALLLTLPVAGKAQLDPSRIVKFGTADTTAQGNIRITLSTTEERRARRLLGDQWKARFVELINFYSSMLFTQMRNRALSERLNEKTDDAVDSLATGEK